ncbi:hypothetical protein CAEBREN_21306 [Caenorhabditis brenneri]|uniref:Uncharacterized protein n=1 Tax=Caenorhabditis brenneri TaxID=135651 RepID=G0MTE0_CAEBE|nr:hypothetical protein CAEBREN_21306 [Caenorhabditis brenneri]
MIQYIILGYLIYEILRLAQRPDVTAVKFAPPPPEQSPPAVTATPGVPPAPAMSPEPPKSEESTAKSG